MANHKKKRKEKRLSLGKKVKTKEKYSNTVKKGRK